MTETPGPEEIVPTVGRLIHEYMQKNGLTTRALAEMLHTDFTYLIKLSNGVRHIGVEMAFRLSEVCGGTPEEWLIMKIRHDCAQHRRLLATRKEGSGDRSDRHGD